MKSPEKRAEKRSETLEVRITPTEKQALQERAATEERGVSAVVRDAISSYLAQPVQTLSTKAGKVWLSMAAASAALAAAVGFSGLAHAETIKLQFASAVLSPEGDKVSEAAFELHVDPDTDKNTVAEAAVLGEPMRIEFTTTDLSEDRIRLSMKLSYQDRAIGTPVLDVDVGRQAMIQVSLNNNDAGASYSLSVLPTRLD